MRVLFAGAMDREIDGLRAHFGCAQSEPLHGAYPFWSARERGLDVGVVRTHVGEANAAIATAEAIRRFAPDCVFKLGCVGGHAAGVHTGDLVSPIAFFHSGAWITRGRDDNRPTSDASRWQSVFGDEPYQINSENLGGRAHVLSPDRALTQRFADFSGARGFAPVRGYVGGSAMWFFDHAFMRQVLSAQVPDAETPTWAADMESYAVAQACAVCRTPFSGLYRVSNSDYYGEPYDPAAVAGLFSGSFVDVIAAFVRTLAA